MAGNRKQFLYGDDLLAYNPPTRQSPFTVVPPRNYPANYQFDVKPGRRVIHPDLNGVQQRAVVRPIAGFFQTTSPLVRKRLTK